MTFGDLIPYLTYSCWSGSRAGFRLSLCVYVSGQEDGKYQEMVPDDSDGCYLPVFFFSPQRSEHFVGVFTSNLKDFTVKYGDRILYFFT